MFSQEVYLSNGGVNDDRHHGFGSWKCNSDEALVDQDAIHSGQLTD